MNKIMTQADEALWLSDDQNNNKNDMVEKNHIYIAYINEHIDNVNEVWKTMKPLLSGVFNLDENTINEINIRIQLHDNSKFQGEEFHGYRQWFYPTESEVADDKDTREYKFEAAWNHHQKRNDHHWEYWVFIREFGKMEAIEMPITAIIEMLCDWTAMSVKFNNQPSNWYKKNASIMFLESKTRTCIKKWLPLFDVVYMQMKG